MGTSDSFYDALEYLNARILATDPGDPESIAHLGECLSEVVQAMEPTSPVTKVLALGLTGLRNIERLEGPSVLDAVASAIAVASEHLHSATDEQSLAALETAAAAVRELLEPELLEPEEQAHEQEPEREEEEKAAVLQSPSIPSGADVPNVKTASEPASNAGFEALAPGWEKELLPDFLVEARDHIATAEASILLLEVNPDDMQSIHTVLRSFHTIKGSAGLVRLPQIQALAHQTESLLIQARDGKIQMARENIGLTLQACDAIKVMLDQVEASLSGGESLKASESLQTLQSALSDAESPAASVGQHAPPPSAAVPASDKNAVHAAVLPNKMEATERPSANRRLTERQASKPAEAAAVVQQCPPMSLVDDMTIRVNTGRLDELVNSVGELVIAQSILAQDAGAIDESHDHLMRSVAHAGKIVRQLQDLALSLRMVPFKGTFQKMSRLVRDLSQKSGKSVSLHLSGEDTEIDRNMVQVLNDPLMHLIRNAVDHGIEPATDRVQRKKNPTSELHLRAYHAGGNVVVELEDDGKGLDRDKIVRQAVEQGLIEAGREPSDDEVYSLIFHPGLSTADQVTDVSGRGVGLDVVRRNIESLRGSISVTTRPGRGTTFTLCVPLTLAILDAMLLRVGRQQYLLPTTAIQRSFRPEPGSVSTLAGRAETVMLHGQLYPLFRLHELFNIDGAVTEPEQAMVLVIEGAKKRCALMVDEILGQQQAVIKSLGKLLSNLQGVVGGAILGNGRVGIILDAVGLVQMAASRCPARYRPSPSNPNHSCKISVVAAARSSL